MENNKIQHPSIEDYHHLEDFSDVVLSIQSQLARLNNHIEILKRVGDTNLLWDVCNQLHNLRVSIVDNYKTTLSHGTEN